MDFCQDQSFLNDFLLGIKKPSCLLIDTCFYYQNGHNTLKHLTLFIYLSQHVSVVCVRHR